MNQTDPPTPGPDDSPDAGDREALAHALAVFTSDCEGRLMLDDQAVVLKYIIDPASGRMIASVPVAVLLATELVLNVPEETDDALQLLLTADEVAEGAATDRWVCYHGEPEHVRWASLWIDSARHGPWVFDGDAFNLPNPLAAAEPALCKELNADKARLTALCQRFAGVPIPSPVCVGIDPRGIHVRARFGVVRVRFESVLSDADSARAVIERMLY